jgi:catechol 2,3-dioxygenase-like lactoylglutathione lyase family enzyme
VLLQGHRFSTASGVLSLDFYRDALGMKVVGGAENHGAEQEHLNQVFGARLRITALRAERGPGIEFLEYITPPGGRPLPIDAKSNDLVFWQTSLLVPNVREQLQGLRTAGGVWVSREAKAVSTPAACAALVRDPDGHALHFIQGSSPLAER